MMKIFLLANAQDITPREYQSARSLASWWGVPLRPDQVVRSLPRLELLQRYGWIALSQSPIGAHAATTLR